MPNLLVLRPADATEVADCWQIALEQKGPSVLALTRQNLPQLNTAQPVEKINLCRFGAYELNGLDHRDVTLIATGSEVAIAMEAAKLLAADHLDATVVSMPSFELFAQQPKSYRDKILGTAPRIGVEAAASFGWDRWLGPDGVFIGMPGFGASAPIEKLYEHFGITAPRIAEAARKLVG
jgi:transketolase